MKSSNNSFRNTATNIDKDPDAKMPPGIPYIVGNELAQTSSSYGMTAILVVFMTQYLLDDLGRHAFTDLQAMVWYYSGHIIPHIFYKIFCAKNY
jgi:dipeptide/tripeptide permease